MWTGAAAFGRRLVCKVFGMASPARRSPRYDAGIHGLTAKGLKAECKQRGLLKYSKLNNAELTSLLEEKIAPSAKGSTSVNVGCYGLTVRELIAECKQRALLIYSKLHEVEQVSRLLEGYRPPRGADSKSDGIGIDVLAVTYLKADCKPRELRKHAKPKKAELLSLSEDKPRGGNDAPPWVNGEDRGKGKTGRYTKRSSSRKPYALQPIAQKEYNEGPTEKDKPGCIYVYFEPGGADNEWKVGRTAQDSPEKRMNDTAKKNGTTYKLKKSWRVRYNGYAERVVHAELHEYAVQRKLKEGGGDWAEGGSEWFKVDYAVLEAIILLVLEIVDALPGEDRRGT